MNSVLKICMTLLIVSVNTAILFGQEKSLERKDFTDITAKAYSNLNGKNYRVTTTTETLSAPNSSPVKSFKSITEIIVPDKSRYIYESGNSRRETIEIGPRRYVKIDNEDWKEDTDNEIGYGRGAGAARVAYEQYKFVGKSKLNGKTVNLYEKVVKLKGFSYGDEERQEIWTEKYWISKDGLLMKTESINETVGKKELQRRISIYEYNPKDLKIEAPIIKEK